jgi:uncharacterized membrane protein YdfJ with MMPL/SSD domain
MLKWRGRWVSRHPWWSVGGVVVLTAGWAGFVSGLRIEADLTKMLADTPCRGMNKTRKEN